MPGSEHTSNGWIEEDVKPDISALSHVGPTITPKSPFVTRELLPLPPSLLDRPTPVIRHVYTRQRKRKTKVVLSDRERIEALEKELAEVKMKLNDAFDSVKIMMDIYESCH
ncbi:hypothetical protein QVD17_16549 [Tagetes erecta]|uniref:Uncharacterized protein n=1 Tax=Tagetes erecta TaxID=13708 RepID=A0AAD8KVE6_TARER|nr:hypothetical protein QVD17_16549 [Tagetes erecta]